MTLDSSPTEGSSIENFIDGDVKPTEAVMLDEADENKGNNALCIMHNTGRLHSLELFVLNT